MTSRLHELHAQGQSIWLDFIQRGLLSSGELDRLINEGIRGLTSNPSIFEKALIDGTEYEADVARLSREGLNTLEIYERIAISDIRAAADAFHDVYEQSTGRDGFVSLEVSPAWSHDTEATLKEARRLWQEVARSNLMVKVPGTPEGIAAFETLVSEGINVNVTLLFSVKVYENVAAAFTRGLQQRTARGDDISRVASVASFFVSRVDSAVDKRLDKVAASSPELQQQVDGLRGKAAIANAKLAYARYQSLFSGPDWQKLAQKGAQTQRVLWASTGTKNPKYSDVRYVNELIGAQTVNTVPPATLEAFRDHGTVKSTLDQDLAAAQETITRLADLGISLETIADELLVEGQRLFSQAFDRIKDAVDHARSGRVRAAASR